MSTKKIECIETGWEGIENWNFDKIYEIIGPDGTVHYTRPEGHPMIDEAKTVKGYSVRLRS